MVLLSVVEPVALDDLTIVTFFVCVTAMSSDLDTGPVSFELAVTVLCRLPPASISAWVTVWLHVYVQISPGSSLPLLFVSPDGPLGALLHFGSLTVIPVRVTVPVFVMVKVYGTDWPAAVIEVVVEVLSTLIEIFSIVSVPLLNAVKS